MENEPNNTHESPLMMPVEAPRQKRAWALVVMAAALAVSLLVIAVLGTMMAGNSNSSDEKRTVSVSGDATVKATPDQYVFYPSYTFKNESKDAALAELTKKSDEVVAGLKKAGVADKDIKTNSSGYDMPVYYDMDSQKSTPTYTLQLTVTTATKELAQKAQDYLMTTTPAGSVSPQAGFSDAKRKQLENQARDQATKDARVKADQYAKNLGFKVGEVKSVNDGSGFGSIAYPMAAEPSMGVATDSVKTTQLAVQPGENSLDYSVTVVYEIR